MAAAKKKSRTVTLIPMPDWKKIATKANKIDTIEARMAAFRDCDTFVHYEVDQKAHIKAFKNWVEAESGWSKEDIKAVKKAPDSKLMIISKPCYTAAKLGFLPQPHLDFFNGYKDELIAFGDARVISDKAEETTKSSKKVVSIQSRMRDQVTDLCSEWDAKLDLIVLLNGEFDFKLFEPYKELQTYNGGSIKPNHAKIVRDFYAPALAEALELLAGKNEDLNEGYANFDKKTKLAFLKFHEMIVESCDLLISTGKAQKKPRKAKEKSNDQIVGKLKYKVNDTDLSLASVNPADIINSQILWVFNVKNRKISRYEADAMTGPLTVKGTSIVGFDIEKSKQRTVRKPDVLKKCGKLAKTKFEKLYKELTTVETKPNGRMNEHCILLKTF